jgi:hypothetical protein
MAQYGMVIWMEMRERRPSRMKRSGIVILSVALLPILLALPVRGACIYGELAGFDVYNWSEQQADAFALTLEGIACDDIGAYYYSGYDSVRCWEDAEGTHVTWYFGGRPLDPAEWKHFGIALQPGVGAPVVNEAILTSGGVPVVYIPFPWQRWEGTPECPVWDIIDWNLSCGPGVYVTREAAHAPWIIAIDDLTLTDPLVIASEWWFADPHEMVLDPFITPLTLEIQTVGYPAELVKYTVMDYSFVELLVFLSEAVLDYGPSSAEETTWGRIKAIYK